jgi:dipeptidase E
MRLLLISNSTNPGEEYLQHPKAEIEYFLGGVRKVLFLPYAAVTFSFNDYEKKVQNRFSELGIEVDSLHHHRDVKKAIRSAEAFVVGGGNTFRLLKMIQQLDIIETLRYKVLDGAPYVGWSAGANVACPTICTTNDMPIVEPDNFSAFNLVRFQINPHYLDANPDGHAGETREERIEEFITMDPFSYVVGLREGSIIKVEDGVISLLGSKSARIFKHGTPAKEFNPGDDLDFLFE